MKKLVLVVMLVLISSVFVGVTVPEYVEGSDEELLTFSGPTLIGGVINANTTWNTTNSPYIIMKNTTLMPGKTLTIEPGTVVKFNNNTQLNIRGTLHVIGNASNRVVFTANGSMYNYSVQNLIIPTKYYYGQGVNFKININAHNGGVMNISFARFEYSAITALAFGGPVNDGKQDQISDTIFSNNNMGFVATSNRYDDKLLRCTFENNSYGASTNFIIYDSYFKNNSIAYSSYYTVIDSEYTVIDSEFINNTIGGYRGYFYNCSFRENHMGVFYANLLKFCTLSFNEIGTSSSYLIKNSIFNNTVGVQTSSGINNNNIFNNSQYNVELIYTSYDANLTNNWWGTTNTTIIDKYIYDVWDEANLHEAKYKPILTNPVSIVNEPPVANAGPDQAGKINDWVFLDGSQSYDLDLDAMTYNWDFGDGTTPVLTTASAVWHPYTAIGIYNVTLTVSDGFLESKDHCLINITKVNYAPIAKAGLDHYVIVNEMAYFNGSGSYDQNNDPLTYYWDFGDGNSTSGWSYSNDLVNHEYNSPGTYNVNLSVSDGEFSDSDYCRVFVSSGGSGNIPPFANAGSDQNVKINETVYFDGSSSYDEDNDTLYYKWDFGDGDYTGWLSTGITNHYYYSKGNYTVTLNVTDGEDYDEDTCEIIVEQGVQNRAPVADAGPDQSVSTNQDVNLNGNNSYDPEDDNLTYRWVFGDNTSTSWIKQSTVTHTYSAPGTYTATLFVTDGELTDSDSCQVSVSVIGLNRPPVAVAGPSLNATVNEIVKFDASGSYDPDGDTLTYQWVFGDGYDSPMQITPTTLHQYEYAGIYTVVLFVSDNEHTITDTTQVQVVPVVPENDLPYFQSQPDTNATAGTLWSYEPLVKDNDVSDTIQITFVTRPSGMIRSGGVISWTPSADQVGDNHVLLSATDGKGIVYQGFNITVKLPVPDKQTPPSVVSTFPLTEAKNISITSKEIHITFSEPMDRSSVEAALSLIPSVQYSVYWLSDDTILVIAITEDLSYNTSFIVTISESAKDAEGEPLESPFTLLFKTESKIKDDVITDLPDDGESDSEKSSGTTMAIIATVLVLLVALVVVLFFMFAVRRRRSEPSDLIQPHVMDERREAIDDQISSEYESRNEVSEESDEFINDLRREVLEPKKPSNFGTSDEEMLNKIKSKYEKGEISQETFDSIEEKLAIKK